MNLEIIEEETPLQGILAMQSVMACRSRSSFVHEAFVKKSHDSAAVMPPQPRTYEEDDKEARGSGFTPPGGKSPLCHQSSVASSKDRCLFPKGITNANLQSHEASCCSSSSSMLPRRKPWPSSSKARGFEAPARCLSISLQKDMEIGDTVQAKAFNVGVIDWGLLERWKYHQKLRQLNEGGDIAQKRRNSFESYFDDANPFRKESKLPAKQSRWKFEGILQQLGQDEGRASTETGRNSCNHQSSVPPKRTMMMRSASFKEGSSQVSTVDGNKENKGRRSPLRRMLDPFLKPKDDGQPFATNGRGCSPTKQALNEDDTSLTYAELANVSLCLMEETARNHRSNSNRHGAETRQAILQFARKNGVPLFIFSSSDGDVLAATATKLSDVGKEDSECVYTIFRIHDQFKKNNGSWNKKSKKHQLASDVVGRMNVSHLRNHDVTKEFVLLGAAEPGTELAAIVVKIPEETPSPAENADTISSPERSNSDARNIVTILPGGIHGSSAEAKPSPLVQRWRSGGACDCGGWDEGCGLTVLTNEVPNDSNSSDSIRDDQIELFLQGGSRTNDHVFRMVSPREGRMSRVEFGTSISWVQAFAICLAILHGGDSRSLERKGFPKSHVSYYPPLSPVGRA